MIIGLVGAIGAGKSEIARILFSCGFRREPMAGPLKDMLRVIGLTEAELNGDAKHAPSPILGGVTPRHAMQTLGTDWGRHCIHPNLWVMLWRRRAQAYQHVVVEDVRFPNEHKALKEMGAQIWRVTRPGCAPSGHVSESYWPAFPVDREIVNFGSILDLEETVDAVLLASSAKARVIAAPSTATFRRAE